jgi:hypothetical protein
LISPPAQEGPEEPCGFEAGVAFSSSVVEGTQEYENPEIELAEAAQASIALVQPNGEALPANHLWQEWEKLEAKRHSSLSSGCPDLNLSAWRSLGPTDPALSR